MGMNVLNLPEEVLVLIFEYLSEGDKLNLPTTCKTFDRILSNNKRLTRYTDVSDKHAASDFRVKNALVELNGFELTRCPVGYIALDLSDMISCV